MNKVKITTDHLHRNNNKKNIILLIPILLIFVLVIYASFDKENNEKYNKKYSIQENILSIDAKQLLSEYNNNEVAADMEYKGKKVLVSGYIDSIGKDIRDNAYLVIGRDGLNGVQCFFKKEEDGYIAELYKGEYVDVEGVVSGKFMNVLVKNAILKRYHKH
jgi:hypothetical protein